MRVLIGLAAAGVFAVSPIVCCAPAQAEPQPVQAAASQCDRRAAAALGVMATRGEGMARDLDAAEAYFDRAAALGFDLDDYLAANGVTRKR